MSEYSYSPSVIEAKVGQEVTLNLVNQGQLDHEIMFGRNMMMVGGVPSGYNLDMFETAGIEPMVDFASGMEDGMMMGDEALEHGGFMVSLPTGDQTAQMSFTVTEEMVGEWEIGCFELDGVHYNSGMVGQFNVVR
jgi:plastocyanin